MRAEEIREWLMERPLQAFRMHLTNGAVFEVRHPDQVAVTAHSLAIGYLPDPKPLIHPKRDVTVSIVHITHLEPVDFDTPQPMGMQ